MSDVYPRLGWDEEQLKPQHFNFITATGGNTSKKQNDINGWSG